ncbi:MAG: hypothetical protein WBN89_15405 [Prochlorococcaceae cyanobacterium]
MGKIFTLDRVNQALLLGTEGDDIVQGSSKFAPVWNGKRGVIRLLRGDDIIRSRSFVQINGVIDLGGGRDVITGLGENLPPGQSAITLTAVDNFNGNVTMGRGRDRIFVPSGRLVVGEDSGLDMGEGNDRIEADEMVVLGGSASAGDGNDRIDVGDGRLIALLGSVFCGSGEDVLIARGGMSLSEGGGVSMGSGNDLIDARNGIENSFYSGNVNLGSGDDRIIGFVVIPDSPEPIEPGRLIGGRGKDTIVLPTGVYEITADQISTSEAFLPVAGINYLEGINGGRFAYAPGILAVSDQGVATFAAAL